MSVKDVVLQEVCEMQPVTVREIVEGTGFSESLIRRTLIVLEFEGLIESETYQRRSRVFMTSEPTGGVLSPSESHQSNDLSER